MVWGRGGESGESERAGGGRLFSVGRRASSLFAAIQSQKLVHTAARSGVNSLRCRVNISMSNFPGEICVMRMMDDDGGEDSGLPSFFWYIVCGIKKWAADGG